MRLKAIPELTLQEVIDYTAIYKDLMDRFGSPKEWGKKLFEEYTLSVGYGKHVYNGKIKVYLTELELSMILDKGYSHFGGSCTIFSDGKFHATIYTD